MGMSVGVLVRRDSMRALIVTLRSIFVALSCILLATGCGGTKVLKEPQPMQTTQALATASDTQVAATLDWVIVRDGPGTWAKNADWDEYLLTVRNLSAQPIQISSVSVIDSLQTRIQPEPGRKKLVKASKQTARRYKESGIRVKAGAGAGSMLVAGAAVTALGMGVAYGAASAAVVSGSAVGAGAAAASGLVLLGPALAVGGVFRAVNNNAVNREIEERQTSLPLEVPAGQELNLDVFFPLAPSPGLVEIIYNGANGEHHIVIDTREALRNLHIKEPEEERPRQDAGQIGP
jgi:hypothetical protein